MMVFYGKSSKDPSMVTIKWAPAYSLLMQSFISKNRFKQKDMGGMNKN